MPLAPSASICLIRSSSGETEERALRGEQHAVPHTEMVLHHLGSVTLMEQSIHSRGALLPHSSPPFLLVF